MPTPPRPPAQLPLADAVALGTAPARRNGVHCGYTGRNELSHTMARLQKALTGLARDPDDDARLAGVAIAAEVVAALSVFAEDARRLRERAARGGP